MNQHHREGDNDGDNGRFQARIDAAIATVRAWEDPGLLREIRSGIPLDVLRDDTGPYSEPRDVLLATGWGGSTNLKCLQRLARYFKSTMTWVDRPPCEHPSCANDTKSEMMEHVRTRGPESQQEREGRAMRVEEYRCQQCLNITTFPRYNSVSALLKSRRGRCGEYANLFGAHCRAMGLETRYILDFTDHVWTECLIDGSSSWVMVDSCEGVVNEPSMYEVGWGKELSYVLAVSNSEVVDVTPRYTRKFYLPNFQTRRRIVTSSEAAGQDRIWRFHQRLTRTLKPKREQEVSRRLAEEESYLGRCRSSTNWDGGTYDRGRISGSSTWKTFRNEDGARRFTNSTSESNTSRGQSTNAGVHQLEVESYCPSMLFGEELSIRVVPHPTASRHAAILLGQTACAVGHCDEGGNSRRLSVVVVDDGEAMLGCLLRSRSFGGISPLIAFLESVPTSRIVAAHGCLPAATAVAVREAAAGGDESSEDDADATSKGASRLRELLPGFITQYLCDGVQFVGQVRMKAEWSTCRSFSEAPFGIEVKLSVPVSTPLTDSQVQRLRLKTYRGIRPRVVTRRLEDRIMPLAAQLTATHGEKRAAFLSWIDARASCAGYVTRPGAPVYLLGQASYPLERVSDNSEEGEWSTFLWLPEPLVSGDDVGIAEVESISGNVKAATAYDVPLDTEFFTSRLGNEIMVKDGSLVDTAVALKNAKLIALYFSADWCRPCRSFTPMLAELYEQLNQTFPTHGLEIVFVSSDRDDASFHSYFAKMPWMALPTSSDSFVRRKQRLSETYGIRGIPSLVVLDAMSGQVVVTAKDSREEITNACGRGDEAIESMFLSWMDRLPPETKEIASTLEMSLADVASSLRSENCNEVEPIYLRRSVKPESKEEMVVLVKSVFGKLDKEHGRLPNVSAAKAINIASRQASSILVKIISRQLTDDTSDGRSTRSTCPLQILMQQAGNIEQASEALAIALKYVENARNEPWNPKFRYIKLSNKVADRMKSVFELLVSFGDIEVLGTDSDFCGSLPIGMDLDEAARKLLHLVEEARAEQSRRTYY